MLQPLIYSKFRVYRVNPKDVENQKLESYPFCEPSKFKITTVINEPATQVVYEDWFKGNDIEWWAWTDAIHFVLEGKAEITLWQPPDMQQKIVEVIEAPAIYLVPRGARFKCHVLSDVPFRRLVCDIPNPGFEAIAGG